MKKRLIPILLTILLVAFCAWAGSLVYYAVIDDAVVIEDGTEDASNEEIVLASEVASTIENAVAATEKTQADTGLQDIASKDISDSLADASSAVSNEASTAISSEASSASGSSSTEASAVASTGETVEKQVKDASKTTTEEVIFFDTDSQPLDYGRFIFTGDSRTVDMFYSDRNEIWGEYHDGIPVYCRDACQSDYMINAINSYGMDNFDTLVTWMGCNDYGNFSPYESYYNSLLQQGKNIIVCTVGPTDNNTLASDFDREYYTNERQIAYNNSLVSWANSNGVKVIDLYSYIAGNGNLYISPEDGIHYMPQPTTEIWYYILGNIR